MPTPRHPRTTHHRSCLQSFRGAAAHDCSYTQHLRPLFAPCRAIQPSISVPGGTGRDWQLRCGHSLAQLATGHSSAHTLAHSVPSHQAAPAAAAHPDNGCGCTPAAAQCGDSGGAMGCSLRQASLAGEISSCGAALTIVLYASHNLCIYECACLRFGLCSLKSNIFACLCS